MAASNPASALPANGLRVGPVAVRVEELASSLSEACARLHLGFVAPAEQEVTISTATVVLGRHEQPAPHLHREVTPFHYDAPRDVYVRANARLHMELRLDGADVRLTAGIRPRQRTGGRFPRHLLGTAASVAAVQADALLMHACAMVSPRGEASLFLGASGDGKTTMTRRLPGWTALADDSVLLEVPEDEEGAWVRGTPFAGSERLPRRGERHPLTRIVILEPGAPSLSLTPLRSSERFTAILQRIFCPLTGGPVPARVVELAARLCGRVPGARLASNLDHDVAPVLGAPE
jgi:hypothetical protein